MPFSHVGNLRLLVCVLAAVSQDLCCWPQRWYDILYKHSLQPQPESTEWFIEDQAFSPSYDFVPPLPSSSLIPPANCLSFSVLLCHRSLPAYWRYWWERGEVGAKSYDSEKAWSSVNHFILSGSAMSQTGYPNSLPPHTPWCSKILAGNCKLSPLPLYPRGMGSWVLGGEGCKTLGLAGYDSRVMGRRVGGTGHTTYKRMTTRGKTVKTVRSLWQFQLQRKKYFYPYYREW